MFKTINKIIIIWQLVVMTIYFLIIQKKKENI